MSTLARTTRVGLEADAAMACGASANAPDLALVDRLMAGSREDFDRLFDAVFPRVFAYVARHLDDPGKAHDLAEDVLTDAFALLPNYRGDTSLLAWSFAIARTKLARR